MLGNTFHLFLRPGLEVIAAHGDLHRFMHWRRPMLTDSGGFQVFSLAQMRKITEEGASFRSPVDGAPVFLSPEESMRIQRVLGSDIAMSFDECTPYPADGSRRRAHRCSCRCAGPSAAFAPITSTLRRARCSASCRAESTRVCASRSRALEDIGFEGLAVGGLAVGETEAERCAVLDELMPQNAARTSPAI